MRTNTGVRGLYSRLFMPIVSSFGALISYTGSLSTPIQLQGTGTWVEDGAMITWTVSRDPELDQPWHYAYTLTVPRGAVSHFILETSEPFSGSAPDFFNASGPFTFVDIKTQKESQGCPNMPSDVYGIRFDGVTGDPTTFSISFDSWRMPVWGDFYSKDGTAGGDAEHYLERRVWQSRC